ncbi:30S ribosomal protein S3 [Mycoplasmopsis bovis]|nr:30S ribosomal protein S3 [Mycoplasmopsis bovis]
MGQKVNPNGFRYGITKPINSVWFAEKQNYGDLLVQDAKIYKFFDKLVRKYQIGNTLIKRTKAQKVTVVLQTSQPAKLLGENGTNIEKITKDLQKYLKNKSLDINLQVSLLKQPELNARLAAEAYSTEIRKPVKVFVLLKSLVINDALRAGAKGIKTQVSGRLNGVDMARAEGYSRGEMRLHTLRQDVDFAKATARTIYGAIGVKVWISKGELLEGDK